jgi:hypothetical protein
VMLNDESALPKKRLAAFPPDRGALGSAKP